MIWSHPTAKQSFEVDVWGTRYDFSLGGCYTGKKTKALLAAALFSSGERCSLATGPCSALLDLTSVESTWWWWPQLHHFA